VHIPGRGLLTEEESNQLFFLQLDDDTEDAPWMVMGSLQWDAAAEFYQSLRYYAESQHRPWFVAGMTPILYRWPGVPRKRQLAPDVFVAFAPDRPRTSFDLDVERDFPPFVLEIISPASADRDQFEKRLAYEALRVREYALFTPREERPSALEGYRRNAAGSFEPWPTDEQGRLWSELLSLYLLARGTTIRAATPDGILLPTLREAEAEIARLRQENEQLKRQAPARSNDPSGPAG
jgi:Uma2 family endonuclease